MKSKVVLVSIACVYFTLFQVAYVEASSVLSFYNTELNLKVQALFTISDDIPKNCHNTSPYLLRGDRVNSVIAVNCIQAWEHKGCQGNSQKIRTGGGSSSRSPQQISKVPFDIHSFQLCSDSEKHTLLDNTSNPSNSNGNGTLVNEIGLELHNKYRRIHNAPDLLIEEDLMSFDEIVQRLRGYSTLKRSGKLLKSSLDEIYGENEAYIDGATSEEDAVRKAIELWYGENVEYDYTNPGYNDETRHFTQLVWKSSLEFAMAVYRFQAEDPNWNTYFVMARYKPYGNVDGQFEQNVLPPRNSTTATATTLH